MVRRLGSTVAVAAVVVGLFVVAAPAGQAGPAPSVPLYGIKEPSADPATQRHVVRGADGTRIFVETWLPAAEDGNVPPAQVPTIVSISPYLEMGTVESPWLLDLVVPRGYAYSQVHVRGTGESGGCIDLFGAAEADDSARAVEYLGTQAPWSDGTVGGYGISYPGGTVLSVAGRGDPARTSSLKAVIAGAPYHSLHEAQWTFDGVPSFLIPATTPVSYLLQSFGLRVLTQGPSLADLTGALVGLPLADVPAKLGCAPQHLLGGLDWSGDHTPWHRARDNRAWTDRISAATFVFHGHEDLVPMGGSPPSIQRGLFDALPESTPRFGLFGVFGHSRPPRSDFGRLVVDWFDHWLRGVDNGVDQWPEVQVQGDDGRWRLEDDWPLPAGPEGRLALGAAGRLGVTQPRGASQYLELSFETTQGPLLPGSQLVFDTGPLPDRLELTGQAELDLWLRLLLPDSHVAARIETYDADGRPLGATYGLRSARHIGPFDDGRFVQRAGKAAPVGRPFPLTVRFQPTDLVVPPGGSLRVVVGGSLIVNPGLSQFGIPEPLFLGPSQPSGMVTPVTVLHDCAHPSVLRIRHPDPVPQYVDVPGSPPLPPPGTPVVSDGGGVTSAPIC